MRNTQRVRVARGPRYRMNRIIRSVCSLVIAIVRQCESVSVNVGDKQLLLPLAFCVVTQRVRYCLRKLHGQFHSFFRRVHFPASFHNLLPRNRKTDPPRASSGRVSSTWRRNDGERQRFALARTTLRSTNVVYSRAIYKGRYEA